MKQNFNIKGMSCAACSSRVEKAVSGIGQLTKVSVNLLTGKMTVEYDNRSDKKEITDSIIRQVKAAGYSAEPEDDAAAIGMNTFLSEGFRRLIVCVFLLVLLAYISMGQMLGAPVPTLIKQSRNPVAYAAVQMLLALSIIILNRKYYIHGFRNLIVLAPDMNSLVSLGSSISFIYSTAITVLIILRQAAGFTEEAVNLSTGLFFEAAGMIPVFISFGKYLEERAKYRTSDSIRGLMRLKPDKAVKYNEQTYAEEEISVQDIRPGDILCVRSGDGIPCDGRIVYGFGGIDESMLSGESLPVDKSTGDMVYEATINRQGYFRMKAEKTGSNTVFSQIVRLVGEASGSRAPIQRLADRISLYFVPVVIIISVITVICWLFLGYGLSFALNMGLSVMVISCPCSLGLATPTAIMAGTGRGADMKILIKSAESLETLHKCDIVCFDKTGTMTTGSLSVSDIILEKGTDTTVFRKLAALLEKKSSHPIACAISSLNEEYEVSTCYGTFTGNNSKNTASALNKTLSEALAILRSEDTDGGCKTSELPGYGLVLEADGYELLAGSLRLFERYGKAASFPILTDTSDKINSQGKTSIIFAIKYKSGYNDIKAEALVPVGIIGICDTLKPDASRTLSELKAMNIQTCMLTGDNLITASAYAAAAGINTFHAGLTPENKLEIIKAMQKEGHKIAMVGDGINDAPSLLTADVGIAIGNGTDVAIGSADIIILGNNLSSVSAAFSLSRATIRNIKQNLFWALFYNCLCIPLAAGILYPFTGFKLNPMIASACMSVSSLFVVTNALRLRYFKAGTYPVETQDKNNYNTNQELTVSASDRTADIETATDKSFNGPGGNNMKGTLVIEGMMCEHCKANVERVLGALPFAAGCTVDLAAKKATVEINRAPSAEMLSAMNKAVTDAGYKVISVQIG